MLINDDVNLIVIHCSATDNKYAAVDIHKLHLQFGWDGIGYHKVILRSGKVENGRPEYWIGAHVKGKNVNSLGVCLVGNSDFTKKQFLALEKILIRWKILYPKAKIVGHRDTGNTEKTCPNFDVKNWLKSKCI